MKESNEVVISPALQAMFMNVMRKDKKEFKGTKLMLKGDKDSSHK